MEAAIGQYAQVEKIHHNPEMSDFDSVWVYTASYSVMGTENVRIWIQNKILSLIGKPFSWVSCYYRVDVELHPHGIAPFF